MCQERKTLYTQMKVKTQYTQTQRHKEDDSKRQVCSTKCLHLKKNRTISCQYLIGTENSRQKEEITTKRRRQQERIKLRNEINRTGKTKQMKNTKNPKSWFFEKNH